MITTQLTVKTSELIILLYLGQAQALATLVGQYYEYRYLLYAFIICAKMKDVNYALIIGSQLPQRFDFYDNYFF